MKTCVSSYSFSGAIRDGRYNQLTLIEKAKEMGFDAIEFTDLCPPEGITESEYALMLRKESERVGLPIASYTIGANFINCENFDEEVKRLKNKVDIAALLGAKVMRHDATDGFRGIEHSFKGFDQALPILAEGCRKVTEYAAEKGISTMVENHGYFSQESTRVEKLVNAVNNPNFGLLVDVGNFACADDYSPVAVGRVAPYAKHVHVKDFYVRSGNGINPGRGFFMSRGGNYLRGAIVGQGDIPVLQCLRALKRENYDGYVSIEFEGMEECVEAISAGLENLKNFINML